MSISRIKPSGWAYGEELNLYQLNQLDRNLQRAFDKTGDTLEDSMIVSSTGAIDGYGDFLADDTAITIQSSGNIDATAQSSIAFASSNLAVATIDGETTIESMDVTGDVAFSNGDSVLVPVFENRKRINAYYLEAAKPIALCEPDDNTIGRYVERVESAPPFANANASPIAYNNALAWTITLGGYALHQPLSFPRVETFASDYFGERQTNLFYMRVYIQPIFRTVLPAIYATAEVWAFDKTTGISSMIVSSASDSADDLTSYTTYRPITMSIPTPVDVGNPNMDYTLIVYSDSTSDPELQASFLYYGVQYGLTVGQLDPA